MSKPLIVFLISILLIFEVNTIFLLITITIYHAIDRTEP